MSASFNFQRLAIALNTTITAAFGFAGASLSCWAFTEYSTLPLPAHVLASPTALIAITDLNLILALALSIFKIWVYAIGAFGSAFMFLIGMRHVIVTTMGAAIGNVNASAPT